MVGVELNKPKPNLNMSIELKKKTDDVDISLEDVIDSRDLLEQRDSYAEDHTSFKEEKERHQEYIDALDESDPEYPATLEERDEAASALEQWRSENLATLEALNVICEEGESLTSEFKEGETLIRESYFTAYAQELAEDCDLVSNNTRWPNYCIDWERAARELKMDYSSLEIKGVTYYLRSC